MAYIGRQLVRGQNRVLDDISSSFNGSTTAFNLTVSSSSSPPASVNQLWIILGGVLQKPGTDFTVADAVLTFTTAPASTLSFWGMIQGDTSDINSPADASVTPSKIANSGDFAFPADVRFKDADGSHYVGLQAPSTVSSNLVWTLPAADGSANQLLKTDGSGALGWASDTQSNLLDEDNMSSNSATQPASQQSIKAYADTKAVLTGSTNNTICTVTGANAISGEANLTFDGTYLKVNSSDGGSYHMIRLNTTTNNAIKDVLHVHSSVDSATAAAGFGVRLNLSGEQSNGNEYTFGGIAGLLSSSGANYGDLALYTNNNGTVAERMRITSTGKIHSPNAVQSGGNSTSGFQFDAVDTSCVLGIQGKSAANGGSANNAVLQGWFGSSNTFRLNCDGLIKTSKGVDFSGAQTNLAGMDSETLDSYEEGTWTPSVNGNMALHASYDVFGYIKVGKLVTIKGFVYLGSSPTGTDALSLSLPFTAGTWTERATTGGMGVMFKNIDMADIGTVAGYTPNGSTTLQFYGCKGSNSNWSQINNSHLNVSTAMYITYSYFAA